MITKNLIEALKKNNTIYINNLGLFENKFYPARIEGGQIFPPHNSITLDTTTEGNGFEFVLFISKEEEIALMEADSEINRWVSDIFEKIESEGSAHYDNFGTFFKKNDKIEFSSDEIADLNISFEGMNPIAAEAAGGTGRGNGDGQGKGKAAVIVFIIVAILSLGFVAYIFRENLTKQFENIISRFGKEVVLPAVKGPYATEFAKTHFIEKIEFKEDTIATPQVTIPFLNCEEPIEEPAEDDTYTEPSEENSEAVTAENTHYKPDTQTNQTTGDFPRTDYEKGKYYAIAGSFGNEADANAHAAQKVRAGYEPRLLYQQGTSRIRICVGVFATSAEAAAFKEAHPDCWILE